MRPDPGSLEPRDLNQLLGVLDHPVPGVRVGEVIARARTRWQRWRIAAAVLLVIGLAGGAWALPQSGLIRWIRSTAARWNAPRDQRPAPKPPAVQPLAGPGIAVSLGKNLVIMITDPQSEGEVRVALVDESEVVVQSSAAGIAFSSGSERLIVDNGGSSASFEIRIPHRAARVEIRIGRTRVFLKEGPRIETTGVHLPDGTVRLPLRETDSEAPMPP